MNALLVLVHDVTNRIYVAEADVIERFLELFENSVGGYSESKSYCVVCSNPGTAKPFRDFIHAVFQRSLGYAAGSNLNMSKWIEAETYSRVSELVRYIAEFTGSELLTMSAFKKKAKGEFSRESRERAVDAGFSDFSDLLSIKDKFTKVVASNGEFLWKRTLDGQYAFLEFTSMVEGTLQKLKELSSLQFKGHNPFQVAIEGKEFSIGLSLAFYEDVKARRNLATVRSWFDEIYQLRKKKFEASSALIWARGSEGRQY